VIPPSIVDELLVFMQMMELLTLTVCNWGLVMNCKFFYICACFIYYGFFCVSWNCYFYNCGLCFVSNVVSLQVASSFARLFVMRERNTLLIKCNFLLIKMVVGMKDFKCH
jgi:hypothetical protein